MNKIFLTMPQRLAQLREEENELHKSLTDRINLPDEEKVIRKRILEIGEERNHILNNMK